LLGVGGPCSLIEHKTIFMAAAGYTLGPFGPRYQDILPPDFQEEIVRADRYQGPTDQASSCFLHDIQNMTNRPTFLARESKHGKT
jgi:hypothetical protein